MNKTLAYGLWSLVAWLFPPAGIYVSARAIVLSNSERDDSIATTALILGLIGITATIINIYLGIRMYS